MLGVMQRQALWFRQCSTLLSFYSCSSWAKMLTCPLCNDTLWPRQCEYCLESPRLQFLDKFVLPSVMHRQVSIGVWVQTVQNNFGGLQLQFLDNFGMPIVLQRQVSWSRQCRTLSGDTQVQFLDKVGVPVVWQRQVSWSRQRRTLSGDTQVQFLDKVSMPVVVASGADGETAEYTRGDSTGGVLGQVVHARCCVWC